MEQNHLNDDFVKYYHAEVRPVAEKCAKGFQTMVAVENGKEVEADDKDMIHIMTSKDPNAIWFIGSMIGNVDRAIIKGIRLTVLNSLSQIHGCLNSDSYWKNVWNDDVSTEEAKNLKELANQMVKLMALL